MSCLLKIRLRVSQGNDNIISKICRMRARGEIKIDCATHATCHGTFLSICLAFVRRIAESSKDFSEARRKVLEDILATACVVSCADIIPAHDSIAPGTCPRCAFRTQLFHLSFSFLGSTICKLWVRFMRQVRLCGERSGRPAESVRMPRHIPSADPTRQPAEGLAQDTC